MTVNLTFENFSSQHPQKTRSPCTSKLSGGKILKSQIATEITIQNGSRADFCEVLVPTRSVVESRVEKSLYVSYKSTLCQLKEPNVSCQMSPIRHVKRALYVISKRALYVSYKRTLCQLKEPNVSYQKRSIDDFEKSPTNKVNHEPYIHVKKSPMYHVKKSPIYHVKKSPMYRVKKSPIYHVKKSPVCNRHALQHAATRCNTLQHAATQIGRAHV